MNNIFLKSCLLVIYLTFFSFSFAQNLEKFTFFPINTNQFFLFLEVDSYGNIYAVDDKNVISKYNLSGELLYSYSNPIYGTITTLDVQNPQKIKAFYKDAAIIVTLNEQLAPLSDPVDLFKLNFSNISLVAFTNMNTIILFDQTNFKLITLDLFFNTKNSFQIQDVSLNPNKIILINENKLVIQDSNVGLLFFDSFGTLEKEIPIKISSDFQIDNSKILFVKDTLILEYNLEKLEMLQAPFSQLSSHTPYFISLKKLDSYLVGIDNKGKIFIGKQNF